jgi:hypothetical protein
MRRARVSLLCYVCSRPFEANEEVILDTALTVHVRCASRYCNRREVGMALPNPAGFERVVAVVDEETARDLAENGWKPRRKR